MIYLTSLSPPKLAIYGLKDQKETKRRHVILALRNPPSNHRAVATVYVSLIILNQFVVFFLLLITAVMLDHYSVSVSLEGIYYYSKCPRVDQLSRQRLLL